MIDAESFPGWKDFAALVAHLRIHQEPHQKIRKVAVVSDSTFLSFAPKIASHFVQADVRHFATFSEGRVRFAGFKARTNDR